MRIFAIWLGVLFAAAVAAAPEGPAGKSSPVKLESIAGSEAKRVILTAKAAERLGIELGKVSEAPIVRKQMVGGVVVPPSLLPAQPIPGGFGGFGRASAPLAPPSAAAGATPPAAGEAWVLVSLSQAEWERLAKDQPARLLPLATRDKPGKEVLARPSGMPPIEDAKRSMLRAYYVVSRADHGLTLNQRMRVELEIAGSDDKRKVVPYSAVYYDAKGSPWVYVSPQPLVFVRERIGVERIAGELAVLTEGPPLGTAVVTVGAPLLYGAEIFKK
jgi:hypothetical protein